MSFRSPVMLRAPGSIAAAMMAVALSRPAPIWLGRVVAAACMVAAAQSPILAQTTGVHTPAAGSAERAAILEAMRAFGDNHDRIFVVHYLRVSKDWAWIRGDPQSADGTQHFEAESALLHKVKDRWSVVDQPCAEADCNERTEILRILAKFPAAPSTIFPD
jgi:hypothetical protein